MRIPHRHLSRREAERLLDDPASHASALGTLLSAASAPTAPDELGREDAAVARFHAARLTPPPASRSTIVSPSRLGHRAATRAVIATSAVVALASGGFALANSAFMPTLPGQASDRATESVAKTPTRTETTDSEEPTESEPTETTDTEDAEESATPTPDFKGLCRAFQATDHTAHGSSLDSAAFTALATEAGGADKVATYCVTLIGEPKETGRPTDKPSPGKPTDRPTPTTGQPTDKPTPATGRPSAPGKPTDRPSPSVTGGGKNP